MSKPDIACPTCGAKPRTACRTAHTNRTTDVHVARWDALYLAQGRGVWVRDRTQLDGTDHG